MSWGSSLHWRNVNYLVGAEANQSAYVPMQECSKVPGFVNFEGACSVRTGFYLLSVALFDDVMGA